ncbi:hypothetical protein GCM10009616_10070 [Microlunatus lacustris]
MPAPTIPSAVVTSTAERIRIRTETVRDADRRAGTASAGSLTALACLTTGGNPALTR